MHRNKIWPLNQFVSQLASTYVVGSFFLSPSNVFKEGISVYRNLINSEKKEYDDPRHVFLQK